MYGVEPLKYDVNALEPYIDGRTIDIHYNKHYLNYLKKLNALLKEENYDFRYSLEELVNHIDIFNLKNRDDILYNLGGVLNHGLYFDNMSPKASRSPVGKLKQAIDNQYGSFETFKQKFIEKANKLAGSGYTFLVIDKQKLKIINFPNQDTPYEYGMIPIMTIDLWEHSYYLKYQNNRALYIDNFFNIVDFDTISRNYEKNI